jgi:hypothetical protein
VRASIFNARCKAELRFFELGQRLNFDEWWFQWFRTTIGLASHHDGRRVAPQAVTAQGEIVHGAEAREDLSRAITFRTIGGYVRGARGHVVDNNRQLSPTRLGRSSSDAAARRCA